MTLLDQILTAMNARGMTQRELAKAIDTSEPYVSNLLREPFNPTLRTLCRICAVLDYRITVTKLEKCDEAR